jgi:hypothetical protein
MRNHNKNRKPLLPFYVIKAAAGGDADAIADVLKHFEGYIAALSTMRLYDENGHALTCVDETMRGELENKLIAGIGKFKPA